MARQGLHHVGLVSNDYEGTVEFYTKVLGWQIAWQDHHAAPDGTELMRHVFFDTGDGSFVAFMCSVPGSPLFPPTWDTGLNTVLGMPAGAYHFAFWVDSVEDLVARQREIRERGGDVTEIFNHGWSHSIYFRDPVNGLMLEYCATTRVLTEDDKILKQREQPGNRFASEEIARHDARIMGVPEALLIAMVDGHERDTTAYAAQYVKAEATSG